MRIGGVQVKPCEEILVLPRGDGDDIVIKAEAVSINEEFEKMVPEPIPPKIRKKGKSSNDYSDKNYLQAVEIRDNQRFAYMVLKSLKPSDIEWEAVDLRKPSTWTKWVTELEEAGLSEVEVNRIINTVMAANSLDENKIDEARKAFLHGQAE